MYKKFLFAFFSILTIKLVAELPSWPQWRGPDRDGQGIRSFNAIANFSDKEPRLVWESSEIPSQDDGGFGSVISDGKNAYVSLVWHRDEPTQERILDSVVMRKLGLRNLNLPPALKEKAEKDRLSLSSRLRGSKLDEWIEMWIDENLDQKQKMTQGSLISFRFKQGKLALPLWVIDRMFSIRDRVFSSQEALDEWLGQQNFPQEIFEKFSQGIPPTKRVADDVVLAIDLKTGREIWKTKLSGIPSGRVSSSTPCLADGKIYAVGGERLFCLEASNGKFLWETPLETQAVASSPLFHENKIYVLANSLKAFDHRTGKEIWENSQVRGKSASPIVWKNQWKTLIACNSSKTVVGVNPETGKTEWEAPGGGASTPTSKANLLLVHGKVEDTGLICFQAETSGVKEKWRFPKLTRRTDSSPLIHENKAILFGAGMRLCIDLDTGEVLRKMPAKHDISSPILVGGTVMAFEINGSFLSVAQAIPEKFGEDKKFKINALKCTSPSLVGTKLLVRKAKGIACYELGQKMAN